MRDRRRDGRKPAPRPCSATTELTVAPATACRLDFAPSPICTKGRQRSHSSLFLWQDAASNGIALQRPDLVLGSFGEIAAYQRVELEPHRVLRHPWIVHRPVEAAVPSEVVGRHGSGRERSWRRWLTSLFAFAGIAMVGVSTICRCLLLRTHGALCSSSARRGLLVRSCPQLRLSIGASAPQRLVTTNGSGGCGVEIGTHDRRARVGTRWSFPRVWHRVEFASCRNRKQQRKT